MRNCSLLLVAALSALLVSQSFSAPCNDGDTSIEASKSSKSANSNSASCDASSEEINAKNDNGEYKAKSSSSSSKTASASSSESVETYKAYKAGASPCGDSLPPRKSGECDETYYKRIFQVSECDKASVEAFYVKVFKQYKGESDCEYVKRIDFIFIKCYKSLDCRLNDEYLCYLEKYYTIKYAKKKGECEEDYFKRTITKTTETEEEYCDKIVILKRYIKTVDWSHITVVYKSTAGYIYKTTSTSTGKSLDFGSCSEEDIKKEYARKTSETDEVYFKRIVKKTSQTQTIEEYVKYVNMIRKSYSCLDLWYNEKYISYTKDYYTEVYKKQDCEDLDKYFLRIVTKESYETDEQAARRANCVRHVYPTLELWSNEKYYDKYTKNIYTIVFKKQDCEDDTTYFKRVVYRVDKETNTCYSARLDLIVKIYKTLTLWYCDKTYSLVKDYYTIKYAKKSGECDEDYIKRLTYKTVVDCSDDIYGQRIYLVHKSTVGCSTWYDEKYISYTKDYYTQVYKKQDCEDLDKYFLRIVTKESYETDEQAARRANCVRHVYPILDLWSNEKYYDKYTKNIYTIVFKKQDCEDDTTYFKRVVYRVDKETNTCYSARLDLIVKIYKTLTLWYCDKTYSIVKDYYTIKYAKKSGECDEDYIKRLTCKTVVDCSDDVYGQRIYLVHKSTVGCATWYDEKYYEKYTKKYYSVYYNKGDKEECTAWLIRVITLISGECEDNAVKRIVLINKSKSGCKCWTSENIKKIECSFKKEYLNKIRKAFIKTSSVEIKKSSKSSSCSSADASESASQVSIKNC